MEVVAEEDWFFDGPRVAKQEEQGQIVDTVAGGAGAKRRLRIPEGILRWLKIVVVD